MASSMRSDSMSAASCSSAGASSITDSLTGSAAGASSASGSWEAVNRPAAIRPSPSSSFSGSASGFSSPQSKAAARSASGSSSSAGSASGSVCGSGSWEAANSPAAISPSPAAAPLRSRVSALSSAAKVSSDCPVREPSDAISAARASISASSRSATSSGEPDSGRSGMKSSGALLSSRWLRAISSAAKPAICSRSSSVTADS